MLCGRVIRGEHPVIAMPVLPRRRHEIREPVEKLKRRELDDAAGPRLRGLSLSADPVGGLVSGQHIADASDAAVGVADHGEPLECKRGPGTVPQEMLERLKVARHVAVEERDPDTRVDGKPTVLPGEHVGGRVRIEKPLPLEESNHAAADPFGERGEVALGERSGGQESRWRVGACVVCSRHEDTVTPMGPMPPPPRPT